MAFQFIITIIIINYLRKSLQMRLTIPEWNTKLMWIIYADIAVLVVHLSVRRSDELTNWLSIGLLSWVMYIIYSRKEFKAATFLLTAMVPYIAVTVVAYLIKLINSHWYDSWHEWIDAVTTFAIIWAFGSWIMTNKQRKELAKARKRAVEEEQNNKVISEMKAQLEVQVAERTMELTKQKEELELALSELKATQSQLIQSEKMASLGELTAGIAHEIQNPLNFVNNFSEVSNELIDEMKSELANGNSEEAIEIAGDVKQNLEKILHHGRRADAIVKGMLQHSRSSGGQKEPTDINALADEYLRLAYHGLRAKDKSFNAEMKTDFEENLPKINVVPQDFGRVILNLITNAFYAVAEKKKQSGEAYEPFVSVITRKTENRVFITVIDNGNGIPQPILDKIFQPFFTTKPTGEGTGLGLSLSYDIVKAHGGEIKVQSKVGEGSRFIISIPFG